MPQKRTTSQKSSETRASPHAFPLISEEMKQWSALLQSELNSWPNISTKSMFGFLFFYRRGSAFAALPKTRGFDSPSSLLFKFNSMSASLHKQTEADTRVTASLKASSKGWFAFEMHSDSDLHDALWWLNQSYEAAKKGAGR
jgi:hypothetical protein